MHPKTYKSSYEPTYININRISVKIQPSPPRHLVFLVSLRTSWSSLEQGSVSFQF